MSKFNLLNYNFTSLLMLFLCFVVIIDEVEMLNNLFYALILVFSIFLKNMKFKYKIVISSILAIAVVYILFILNDYTLSKEYFINLILGLIFLKFSEIKNRDNYYFFNYSCVFFAISSLIFGQDLISSLLSSVIVILSIINIYSLNQSKILKVNFKNLLRYLAFALSVIPVIAIVYFTFPRTELNIKLFETKKNQLGIPDKISLGSFQDISDSDEVVFIYSNTDEEINKKFYFRVKIFDKLTNNKDWVNTEYKIMLSQFKNNFRILKNDMNNQINGSLIIFPHEKKWIPKLKNFNYTNKDLSLNLINNTVTSNKILTNKKSYKLIYEKKDISYQKEMIKYYTLLPNNISSKITEWAEANFAKSNSNKDYLDKILNEFRENNFYYSLTPSTKGNDYENFFFLSKTGYCEYYAGTFALLARLAGIPSRIVTGYYGGSYNDLGKFYTFKQQDAHSWVEVFLDNEWQRYDPTLFIPNENILESNNINIENSNTTNQVSFEVSENRINKIGIYFDYINYVWTNSFLKYDEKSRKNFIKNNFANSNNLKILIILILFLIISFYIFKLSIFFYHKKILYSLFFNKLKNKNNLIKNHMTHQEIYKILEIKDQKKFYDLFKFYEKNKFDQNISISLKNFYDINFQILKYVFSNK